VTAVNEPLVSVVVPVFNGAPFLAATLASVLAQDYPQRELIVVDDGSSDGSAEIAASVPGAIVLRQSQQGPAAARNAGIAAARGSLISFLDQDDCWRPNKLSVQTGVMRARPELGMTITGHRLFLEPGRTRPGWLRPDMLDRDLLGAMPGVLMVTRATFAQIGTFDPANVNASDVDWFLRALDLGVAWAAIPQVLLDRRIHSENQSAQVESCHAGFLAAVRLSIARKRTGAQGRPPSQPPSANGT
jgi:glycosyltransferase involved in cell wall biosynthesis